MSQVLASSSPVTVPPTCAAVRSMPSRMKPVGVHVVAAKAAAGTTATAMVAIIADADARPTRRRLVKKLDIVSSDGTIGVIGDIPNPDRRPRAIPAHGRAERPAIRCAVAATRWVPPLTSQGLVSGAVVTG